MQICSKERAKIIGKTLITQVTTFCVIIGLAFGTQSLFSFIDEVAFPYQELQIPEDVSEKEKGVILIDSITKQLRYELNSTFGWTANDMLFNYYIMDNRAYRQFGVYSATKTIFDHFSTNIAKLGSSAKENDDLYATRMNHLALAPSKWGYLFIPSAESAYSKGLSLVEKYKKDLLNDKAIYNCRSDDIYSSLQLITGDRLLGLAIGILQNDAGDEMFWETDNRIYEAQGIAIVVRDFFDALYKLYPDVTQKGNKDNYDVAMRYLNDICEYDPLFVLNSLNSRELIISYLLFAKNRIEDIMHSIRI